MSRAVISEPPAAEGRLPDEDRRASARACLGVTGRPDQEPLAAVLREAGCRPYPVLALGLLAISASLPLTAVAVLLPQIDTSGFGSLTLGRALAALSAVLGPLAIAARTRRPGRRARMCLLGGVGWSLATLILGLTTSLLFLTLLLVLAGLAMTTVPALHTPMLADGYPPAARVRIFSVYAATGAAAGLIGPGLVLLLDGAADLSWRGTLLVVGIVAGVGVALAGRLRDPEPGRFDTATLHQDTPDDDADLGFFETTRRLLLIVTLQRLLAAFLVVGFMSAPLLAYVSTYLDQRGHLQLGARATFFAIAAVASIVGLAFYGPRAERVFHTAPGRLLDLAGVLLASAGVVVLIAVLMPWFWLTAGLLTVAMAIMALVPTSLNVVGHSLIDARHRPHLAALVGSSLAAGAIAGAINLASLGSRFGVGVALGSLAFPCLCGGWLLRASQSLVGPDLDRTIGVILEAQDIAAERAAGRRPALLSVRGINFSYGQLQVLFGVDFTVDDGEMVALLGTNGAGKSTLLKVISGIGLPSSGTVRYQGRDITYLDAERRLRIGITQIPGGRAVVGQLDVIENLRGFAYTLGGRRADVDEAIERCLTAFPRLAERRTSLAATLSGGEQQMLGLCRALILKPRLLLIDELSLGLAPVIVTELLGMVRRINAEGTAIVLVEQSVNIALSLVQHAYFMEKGEVRFDGTAAELIGRDDLLRAVFLEGATKGAGQ